MMLNVKGEQKPFYITYMEKEINNLTQVYQCRWQKAHNHTGHTHMTRNKFAYFTANIVYKK